MTEMAPPFLNAGATKIWPLLAYLSQKVTNSGNVPVGTISCPFSFLLFSSVKSGTTNSILRSFCSINGSDVSTSSFDVEVNSPDGYQL